MAKGYEYFKIHPAPDMNERFEANVKKIAPAVFLLCYRNKNRNVVVYEACLENGQLVAPYVRGYWLMMETDCKYEKFSDIDSGIAWGFKCNSETFSFNNFPLTFNLRAKGDATKAFVKWKGHRHVAKSVHLVASDITASVLAKVTWSLTMGNSLANSGIVKNMYLDTYNQSTKSKGRIQIVPQK